MAEVEITSRGPVTVIRINRPHVRNAINGATARALREAWLAFEADEGARVGILTGGDEVFCAGADLEDLEALAAQSGEPYRGAREFAAGRGRGGKFE
ncbi:MAG: enoyl-CoA hydratase/isomerase family protein [Firmicutes bacterium]|nr:enoyl-CoA hydratase/isomerase family protein [Bacillota bacterium]